MVGSGPAGQKAAIQGAKAGKKVVLIEQEQGIGGNCVYRGHHSQQDVAGDGAAVRAA
ncbi:MAG: FAD-dependent oxidoreductase [Nitrospira sp.]|nr:FAD-dependent oxidoreductase [Nitrospira sp.]